MPQEEDSLQLFIILYIKASNKLLRAVLADIKCPKLLAGVRALGILHIQFTEPYWHLVERKDITVLDMISGIGGG